MKSLTKEQDFRMHTLGLREMEGINDEIEAAWVAHEIDYYLAKLRGMTNKRTNKGFKRFMRNHCVFKWCSDNEDLYKRINKIYEMERIKK